MKTKIFLISVLGVISTIIGCASMPVFLALIPCVIFLGWAYWLLFIPLGTFLVFIPLWWWCEYKANELYIRLLDNKGEKK